MKYLGIISIFSFVLLLTACGHDRGSVPPTGSLGSGSQLGGVGSILQEIGSIFLWAGASVVGAAVVALIASFIPFFSGFLSGLRTLLVDGIVIGISILLLGASFTYLGEHPWILALAIGLIGALLLVRYRLIIERDLGITQTQTITSPTVPGAPVVAQSVTAPVSAPVSLPLPK